MSREKLTALVDAAHQGGTKAFTRQDWAALLSDSESIAQLAGTPFQPPHNIEGAAIFPLAAPRAGEADFPRPVPGA